MDTCVEEIPVEQKAKELYLATESFTYFLKFCKVVEPPTRENTGGVKSFELWPHLLITIRALLEKKLIVVLKARQIGLSWLLAAYALWLTYKYGTNVMLFSKGEVEAGELLEKCRRIYNHLPEYLKHKLGKSSMTEMYFPSNEAAIKAFAATENAGISFTASCVICDEWEEHPYAESNFLSTKPTMDMGGQFIGCFTVNKARPETLAKKIYREAIEGKNGFTPLFFPWNVRPGRDKEWYEATKKNIPPLELSGLTPELFMEQNYPASDLEALRTGGSIAAFNHDSLDNLMQNTRTSVPHKLNKIIKIYKPFILGNYYVAGTDVSHGVGKDYSVTCIMNSKTGEVVADILRNDISTEELAYESIQMLKEYRNPKWWIERNDWGQAVINKAVELGYKNLGKEKDRYGVETKERNRIELFAELIPAINNQQIVIYNSDGLKQFYDVVRNPKKNGKIESPEPRHDDYPMAVGICWIKRESVTGEWKPTSFRSLRFSRRR